MEVFKTHTGNKEIIVSIIRKAKYNFYDNLDPKVICEKRKFIFVRIIHLQIVILPYWRIMKSLLIHQNVQKSLILFFIGSVTSYFFIHFCPGTMTTHAESIYSVLQRGQTFTTHTTLNTEQNQLAIKVLPQR